MQPRGGHPEHPGRTGQGGLAGLVVQTGQRTHLGRRHREIQHHESRHRPRSAADLQQRARRRVQQQDGLPGQDLRNLGHRPRGGMHPRRGARLQQRRRTGRAVRQHRPGRLRGENRRSGRKHLAFQRAGQGVRLAGRRLRGHPERQRGERRRGGHHPRRSERRPGHAGNALPDFVPEEPPPG